RRRHTRSKRDWSSDVCSSDLGLTKEALWTKLLPGLLISGNLMLQRKRVPDLAPKWFLFTACTFLLQPYYTVLIHTDVIPTLIERKSTRLNSSHVSISYAVFCLKNKKKR